jgi:Txe/YoeB family toxin of toxin-antitoxin system
MYKVRWETQAEEDYEKIKGTNLLPKLKKIMATVRRDPYEKSQRFERLKYDLAGMCSRHLNQYHRFLYEVLPNSENLLDKEGNPYEGIVNVASMLTHYGKK